VSELFPWIVKIYSCLLNACCNFLYGNKTGHDLDAIGFAAVMLSLVIVCFILSLYIEPPTLYLYLSKINQLRLKLFAIICIIVSPFIIMLVPYLLFCLAVLTFTYYLIKAIGVYELFIKGIGYYKNNRYKVIMNRADTDNGAYRSNKCPTCRSPYNN
jgi:hypothetical protein